MRISFLLMIVVSEETMDIYYSSKLIDKLATEVVTGGMTTVDEGNELEAEGES
jgi:hypothetical protein